jgi:streptomycin 3"-adenylyltransferase
MDLQRKRDAACGFDGARDVPEAHAAVAAVATVLGRPPIAAYVVGSAVAGGLRPLSDVDVLGVVAEAPDAAQRRQLADALMRASGRYGGGGPVRPLDVVLVRYADVVPWRYPPVRSFAYGEWLREAYAAGLDPLPGPDPDLAIQLAQARATGVALHGPRARDLLAAVPTADLRRALRDALPALLADLRGDERNVLLTLARMWRTASNGDFVPKDVGAAWAVARLPVDGAALLELAARAYRGEVEDTWEERAAAAATLAERMRLEVVRTCADAIDAPA